MSAYRSIPDHCWAKIFFDYRKVTDIEPLLEYLTEMRGISRDTAMLRIRVHRALMERMNYAPDAGVWSKYNMHHFGKYMFSRARGHEQLKHSRVLSVVAEEEEIPAGEYVLPLGLKAVSGPHGLTGALPWFGGPLDINDRIAIRGGDPRSIDTSKLDAVVKLARNLGCPLSDLLGV